MTVLLNGGVNLLTALNQGFASIEAKPSLSGNGKSVRRIIMNPCHAWALRKEGWKPGDRWWGAEVVLKESWPEDSLLVE